VDLAQKLRIVPDFPHPGIRFVDITPLLQDHSAFRQAFDQIVTWASALEFDLVVAPEARGFLLGAPLALQLGKGFVPVRKPGKLPHQIEQGAYQLEYGEARLEIHRDALLPGQRVLVVDDLLATGGTVLATADLVQRLGGKTVGFGFLVELAFLPGRASLGDAPVFSVLKVN
jgi:adenine phosphoribosyltransferase